MSHDLLDRCVTPGSDCRLVTAVLAGKHEDEIFHGTEALTGEDNKR